MLAATWPHDRDPVPAELLGRPTLPDLFARVAGTTGGDHLALVDGEERIDATGIAGRSARLAGGLAASGVTAGDVVAFQLPAWWETVALYRACWTLGAVAAPIHHLATGQEAGALVRDVDPALCLAAPDAPLAERRGTIAVREGDRFPELAAAPPYPRVDARPADLAVVLFTSGSTGRPKGVLHTHRGLAAKASQLVAVHGLRPDDVILMPAPMAHISGLLNAVLLPGAAGLTSVLMDRWHPGRALTLIAGEGVTVMMGPPTFFRSMMGESGFDRDTVASVRLISCGGAGVTPAFVTGAADAFGATVKRTYGSTEAPVVTTWHAGDPPDRAASHDGRAIGATRLRVVDPSTGAPQPPGTAGELWVSAPELFVGYAEQSRNEGTVTDGGWFRTGDLATLDGQGWLRIVGRIKDLIIRGGENVAAAEVESVLETHPGVEHAVAVGYPDERLGERVCAFVTGPGPFDLEECRRWCEAGGLARFKWPERVVVLDELPILASSGKPDRGALRERAATAT